MVSAPLARAYAACERLAREHYENFPVVSLLLQRRMRPHVAAVYAFARIADDIADEGDSEPADRLARLDDWLSRLYACQEQGPGRQKTAPGDLVFLALGETIRACRLPVGLFEDLLSAFRQDVSKHRYADFAEVLDYCRRSANPVGRLVLRIAGYEDGALDAASDAVCTALQLTNFWQDLARDWHRGRLYVPQDVLAAHGAQEDELRAGRLTPAWTSALREMAAETRALFGRGRPVCSRVRGRLGLELRVTWLGGSSILDRLERVDFDVFHRRPALGAGDAPGLIWRAVTWRKDQ
jgi:squalene synthase HpnC